jgi:hypothetical protein
MAKFNGPREPFRPPEPAPTSPGAVQKPRNPTAVHVPEAWTESSFDLRQGLDVIEHVDVAPAAKPPRPEGR